jgi:hypothetical protein
MTQYEWKIRRVEVIDQDALESVVVTACFEIKGKDGELAGLAQSDVRLLPPDALAFIEFENLTEEQVVEWVKQALGDRVAVYEERVQTQIDAQKVAQPKAAPLPWA